ncbi:MAG: TIGR04282 family arsenosugar biosynthesis glycosyltransferase [Gammaproteobacteria bacterium]|nr:TIGR04282 family arsenosugar biosynthesis glycosyltransferase [Gammaproteobacteria bacterium]
MKYRYQHATILVFAKAPVAGKVKTRLVPPLKPEQAATLHQKLLSRTLKMATKKSIAPVILYCSPDENHPFFQQCKQTYSIQTAQQVGKDLGARMHHALDAALKHNRYAILIGTDCPSMNTEYLEEAIQRLRSGSDVVIGPANDGGYVLIGMKKIHAELFSDIAWGENTVFGSSMERIMQAGLQLSLLESLQDIDRPEDLHFIKEMR